MNCENLEKFKPNLNANQLWRTTELIKLVGEYKGEMERAEDFKRIKHRYLFAKTTCLTICSKHRTINEEMRNSTGIRINLSVVRGVNLDCITIILTAKHKKKPFYVESLILEREILDREKSWRMFQWLWNDNLLWDAFTG